MKNFIKEKVRSVLTEVEGVQYKFGCVMLYFDIPKDVWGEVQALVDDKDVSNVEDADGRELNPHVTLLYGLHADIPDKDIEEAIGKMSAPEVTLKDITTFSNKDFDVVKFDVEGEGLIKMNKVLTEFPHTTDYPNFHPHTTLAYVKPGEGKKYHQELDEPIVVIPNKVVYSKPDGTRKEYPFESK